MNIMSTEEKIKRAALKEFAAYGFEGARIDRIAGKAKVNKAMIYYHYKNKESLYEAVLATIHKTIVNKIINAIPKDKTPEEQLQVIVSEFISFTRDLDKDFVKMMLREISSGGKFFKKLMLPNVILPMMKIVQDLFNAGIKARVFKNVIPHITFIQVLGAVMFSNAIRVILADTSIGKAVFKDSFFDDFKENLLTILKSGILVN